MLHQSWRVVMICSLVCGLGMAVAPVQSAVLLVVDVSDPAAVTFTSTGNFSQINDSTATVQNGVDLMAFFTAEQAYAWSSMTGNLTPPSNRSLAYGYWSIDPDRSGNNFVNLNIQGWTGTAYGPETDLQNFSTTAAAFTGAGTIDLSGQEAGLPVAGTTGDIIVGSGVFGSREVIGQWSVTPEPSTLALMILAVGLKFRNRRGA